MTTPTLQAVVNFRMLYVRPTYRVEGVFDNEYGMGFEIEHYDLGHKPIQVCFTLEGRIQVLNAGVVIGSCCLQQTNNATANSMRLLSMLTPAGDWDWLDIQAIEMSNQPEEFVELDPNNN